MRVHHLDCCTMCPRGQRAINGEGARFARVRLVSHCLLLETDRDGLVLVDSGIGVEDVTHIDFDHAGGLPDFPAAKVHVHANERDAALARRSLKAKTRYRQPQLEHGPAWEVYDAVGEPWNGMPAVRQLVGLPPEILALPMAGHSRGHAAIAVDTRRGWLVHAGDAYFHRSVLERGDASGTPWALRWIERLISVDYRSVRRNHALLAELSKRDGVTVFSAHDAVEFERIRSHVA